MEDGLRYFFITAPLIILIGGGDETPFAITAFIILNGVFMHWNVAFQFGLFEKIIITPAYHRIHHSIEEKHYNKNFGVFTQLWDRVFKTRYLPQKNEYPITGVLNFSEEKTLALLLPWPVVLRKANVSVKNKS